MPQTIWISLIKMLICNQFLLCNQISKLIHQINYKIIHKCLNFKKIKLTLKQKQKQKFKLLQRVGDKALNQIGLKKLLEERKVHTIKTFKLHEIRMKVRKKSSLMISCILVSKMIHKIFHLIGKLMSMMEVK